MVSGYISSLLKKLKSAVDQAFKPPETDHIIIWDTHREIYDRSREEIMEGKDIFDRNPSSTENPPVNTDVYGYLTGRSLKKDRCGVLTPKEVYAAAERKVNYGSTHTGQVGENLFPKQSKESFEVVPPEVVFNPVDSTIGVEDIDSGTIERMKRDSSRIPKPGDRYTHFNVSICPGKYPDKK